MNEIKEQEFDTWKVGDLNTSGVEIKHIFHRNKSLYIIYESDVSSLVSYKTNPKFDYSKKLLQFEKEFSLIKGLLTNYKQRKRFIPRIAAAIKCCFEDKTEVAKQIIDDVIKSISNYKIKIGRLEYLLGAIVLGVLAILISMIVSSIDTVKVESPNLIYNTIIFGILGGFLSISTNLTKIEIDIESGSTKMHFITGTTRILISIISSVLILYLIDSGLIIGNLLEESNRENIIYVFAALAGFSERLIPNILDKISKSTTASND